MISRCFYSHDSKSPYKDDYIIRIDRPQILKKHVVIFHNTSEFKKLNDFYSLVLNGLSDYKIIYTSKPNNIFYSSRSNKIPNFSSTFNMSNLNQILECACAQENQLYVVILITPTIAVDINSQTYPKNVCLIHFTPESNINELNEQIKLVSNYKIKINSTNIKSLIGQSYSFDSDSTDLVIFVDTPINFNSFNNWVKYSFEGFNQIEYSINLKYNSSPDLISQFICLKNLICDITADIYPKIKKKFLHSLNYLNINKSIGTKELFELVSSTNFIFNIYQNKMMTLQLNNSNPLDNLFLKSFSITPNYLATKQSKTFISNKIKLNKTNVKTILKPNIEVKNSPNFINSLDQIVSPISLSNWYDEYLSESCLGLLVKIKSEYSDRMGWTTDTIQVNTTFTLIGREQIYDGHDFFWQKNSTLDNGQMEQSLISGSQIGSGNSLIPLYINEYHWVYASKYTEELLSVGITQNPYLFKPTMYKIYAHVLLGLISETIKTGCTYASIRSIVWIIQTIRKLQLDLVWNSLELESCQDIRVWIASKFLQWVNGSDIFDIKFIFNIYQEIIRRNMRKEFKTKKDIKDMEFLYILNKSTNKENIQELENLYVFVSTIQSNQIIKLIESSTNYFGFIPDNIVDPIKNSIKANCKIFNIKNIFALIQPNLDTNKIIEFFTYQTFLSRIPKLKFKLKETIGMVNLTDTKLDLNTLTLQLDKINYLLNSN